MRNYSSAKLVLLPLNGTIMDKIMINCLGLNLWFIQATIWLAYVQKSGLGTSQIM